MTWRREVLACAVGALIGTGALQAQSPTGQDPAAQFLDPRGGVGLDAAVARALAQEPALRATRVDVDVARGERQQAALRPNPMVSVEHRAEPGGTDALTTVGVEWPLDLFRRQGRVQTADRSIGLAEVSVEEGQRLLVAAVRLQYGVAASAIREVTVADEIVLAAQRQLSVVRARVEAGRAPPLEADLLEVEVRRLEAARAITIGRAEAAMAQLRPLLAMGEGEPLLLRDSLESLIAAIMIPRAEDAPTVAVRSDVQQAEARVALADARIDRAQREGRADLSLFATYMRMDNGFPQQAFGPGGALERVRGRFDYVAVGAAVSLPVLNRNQGQVAAARAERLAAEARREAVERAAGAETAAAEVRDARAQQAVQSFRDGLRELARRNLDVVRQTFELGRATVFDVLAEQKRWLEIEQEYNETLREAWEARVALSRARGETR
jgi:cobalt-zinc-cadmium efflux system outer membrane protein